jgi:hypothetical protein
LQAALSIAIYIICREMSVFGVSVQKINLEMKSVLASNTPSGITTKIKHMVRPTPLAADAKLSSHHIPQGFNVFHYIFCVMNNLPKPNLYHTMQIHILHPPHKWTIHLMKLHT